MSYSLIHQRVSQPNHESTIRTQTLRGEDDEPLRRELLSFVNAVKNGTESLVPGEQGVASLELAHRVLEAIRVSGRRSSQPAFRTMSS